MKREIKILMRMINQQKNAEKLAYEIEEFYKRRVEDLESEVQNLRNKVYPVKQDWAEELFEIYPLYLSEKIQGKNVVARGMGKTTISELNKIYTTNIKNNKEKHAEIKELIKWGEEAGLIKYNFGNFLLNRDYERLQLEKSNRIIESNKTSYGEREL
jgi:hypothetical protein